MRILCSGSRLRDVTPAQVKVIAPIIRAALTEAVDGQPGPHTVVHGAAAGVDAGVDRIGRLLGMTPEPHPADWPRHKRAAGAIRNRAMVALGADLLLAFPWGGPDRSPGTHDCVDAARRAGIPVKVIDLADYLDHAPVTQEIP